MHVYRGTAKLSFSFAVEELPAEVTALVLDNRAAEACAKLPPWFEESLCNAEAVEQVRRRLCRGGAVGGGGGGRRVDGSMLTVLSPYTPGRWLTL